VSFEHEIENRKPEYYNTLMQAQKKRPGEHVDEWVTFFLDCLLNIQDQLMNKLNSNANTGILLDARKKNILTFIENHPGTKSGEIAKKLSMPLSTVKKMLTTMVESKIVLKYGIGAGTHYLIEKESPLKEGLMFQLTNANRKKEFVLQNPASFVEIKEIVITPLFSWQTPDEWAAKLSEQGLGFNITGITSRDGSFSHPFYLSPLISLFHFKPKITLSKPISIPFTVTGRAPNINEYPIKIEMELLSSVSEIDFDVIFIYDEV
jgi:DNA-binding Lrp family transcriptional regulator